MLQMQYETDRPAGERIDAPAVCEHDLDAAEALTLPRELPILPVVANVIFPSALYPLTIQGAEIIDLLLQLQASRTPLGLFLQRDPDEEQPGPEDIYHVGTAALIYSSEREDADTLHVTIQGLTRIR